MASKNAERALSTTSSNMSDDDSQPTKRMRYDFTDMVTIVIRDASGSNTTFQVPRNLLCARSRSFSTQMSPHGETFRISIIHEPETFSIYLQLLYTGEVVLPEFPLKPGFDHTVDWDYTFQRTIERVIELYKVADELQDHDSVNRITDFMVHYVQEDDMHEAEDEYYAMEHAYKETGEGSPARRIMTCLAADRFGTHLDDEPFFKEWVSQIENAKKMLFDLAVQYHDTLVQGQTIRKFNDNEAKDFYIDEKYWDEDH